jgi:signal transduction histidine kinase
MEDRSVPGHSGSPLPSSGGRMIRDIPFRTRIALGIFLCGLIPLFLLALVGLDGARSELKAMAYRQLRSVREIKATVLRKFYFERRADVRVFAANPYILRTYEALDGPGGARAAAREDPFLRALVREYRYRDLFLLRPSDGAVLYSLVGRSAEASRSVGLAEARRSAAGGEIGISDLRLEPGPEGDPAQYLAAAIERDGRPIGLLAVELAPDAIDSILGERSGQGETGSTYLLGPDGRVRSPLRPASLEPDPEIAGLPAAGCPGERLVSRPGGERVLVSFAPIDLPGLTWTIVAEVGEREIDAQIARALNGRIVVLIGASTLLLAALAFLIARGLGRAVGRVIGELDRLMGNVLSGLPMTRARPDEHAADFRPVLAEVNALIDAYERQSEASRRLESHIRDGQRLEVIGSLAGGISHDFNNLLAHMRALVHILENEAFAERRDPGRFEDLKLALRRGSDLVGQILTFSKPSQDRKKVTDLRRTVGESLQLVRAALPTGVLADFDPGPDALPVSGDPAQIHQIVMNLCINAVQALQEGGGSLKVTLRLEEFDAGDVIEAPLSRFADLTVEDDGPGMTEEVRTRIFEPFFTTKPPEQGTGLGLSVVAGIVLNLGGTIQVTTHLGRGSRFDIYLPLVSPKASGGDRFAQAGPGPGDPR